MTSRMEARQARLKAEKKKGKKNVVGEQDKRSGNDNKHTNSSSTSKETTNITSSTSVTDHLKTESKLTSKLIKNGRNLYFCCALHHKHWQIYPSFFTTGIDSIC